MRKYYLLAAAAVISIGAAAQKSKAPVSITGSMGISYEGYGLTVNPKTHSFYSPRKPWNQFRFNFAPQIKIGKNFSLPLNFNFATRPTNFLGPYAGLGALGHQSFKQFITNPMNNFSVNPKYKWAELQLGTQYLNYSELTTGDIAVFGAGFDLKPKGYLIKFFTGTSQQGINPLITPYVPGAYKRTNWMAQLGKEKEGKYKLTLNIAKGRDFFNSVTGTMSVPPQEGLVASIVTDVTLDKGFYIKAEGAQGIYTQNMNDPLASPTGVKSFKPFIDARTSSTKDYAASFGIGKKTSKWELGFKGKYLGAGYLTMGYPYLMPDRLDLTVNTRFNAWKNKMNVVATAGERINNMSNTTSRAKQFIGNLNWFTQFSEKFTMNITYNNFGFNTNSSTIGGLPSIKNVSNDIGINPTYTWSNDKMSNILSLSYNFSKYDETIALAPLYIPSTTSNNTHTAMLSYVPVYFTKKISPDFSVLYFLNKAAGFTTRLFTISSGLGMPVAKDKINLKGQLMYTSGKNGTFTSNNNFIASLAVDYAVTKKITWNTFMTTNYFKYGNELTLPALIGANYLESTVRTGITYKWK